MEKRQLGRTGQKSTVVIFGGAALGGVDQETANKALDLVKAQGVNHLDVAYSYGHAEERLGPWLESRRGEFFLSSKTGDRTRDGAWKELQESLERLRTDHLDLYQIHAVTTMEELDKATGPGGALETFKRARDEGLTRFLGITGHGLLVPKVHMEALSRFDFDTVLFPINPNLFANADYRRDAEQLLAMTQERNVGVIVIKSIARQPWGEREHRYATWYEPYVDEAKIAEGVRFVLSQPGVTCIASAGDVNVMPKVIEASEAFEPMDAAEQEAVIEKWASNEPIFEPA